MNTSEAHKINRERKGRERRTHEDDPEGVGCVGKRRREACGHSCLIRVQEAGSIMHIRRLAAETGLGRAC